MAGIKNNDITGIVNGKSVGLGVDSSTHTIETIDYAHHEIHSGSHYYMEGFVDLDNEDELNIQLITPAGPKQSHFLWSIASNGILETYLYEDPTSGMTGGSVVSVLNNDRNSTKQSGMVITNGVADPSSVGTLISSSSWGSRNISGSDRRENEIILKEDSIYLRKFISGANNNLVSFRADWYEHSPKD